MSTTKRSFKRPFQPSISSYFGRSTTDIDALPTPHVPVFSPTLPAAIQSSLFNVGMRIRKSVPEGYKTPPKTFCGSAAIPAWSSPSVPPLTSAGLVPYCGIFKGDAHDAQPVPEEEDLPPLQFDHGSWDLELPSSQESASSAVSIVDATHVPQATSTNKRRREDADEEDLDIEAQPVSPRSRPISHTRMPNLDSPRLIAVPKTRRKALGYDDLRESEMLDVGDFEEAGFLMPVLSEEGPRMACDRIEQF